MLVIALDTSTPAVTAGLVTLEDGGPRSLAERVTVNPRAHGELLTPQLLEVLAEAGYQLGQVGAIVVGSGPGPFTGLRVGMVTAAALGHACATRVYPVCSLDAIAAQTPGDDPLLVATDARRKEVYWAAYGAHRPGGARARLTEPGVERPENVPGRLDGLGVRSAAGEMALRHREVFALDPVEPSYPTPAGLIAATAAELRAGAAPQPLVPLYLRRPDAGTPGPPKPVSAGTDIDRGRT
ncbi:tRNA threonylcarbamoyl adenosine modification protein YeaZ [Halopolyspora algeriensis]|uniref:tRNA threonylcarbamoyl adenosine modification protein YeaZ n=1 Tax=Halopolyspora algeriensis TaxID=1500506 RepID=A0A368VZ98_9ACTN|nr:tRNA (adenosine(37)-N6)-threonylcarbamoyltransferase complex dimerization subunit type 1 TsaB [Halopolyspora algeriensis]RCW46702.1 tRNA threonylcarbamoyl adenosine modification protein YeaZ [Halopolyspora algeriensis]TQM46727.1 tRNA threonylcarbamoyl adenosine modification protein YeaZ [Halopolyspora algeriensis]